MLVLATFFPTSDVSPGYMDFMGVGAGSFFSLSDAAPQQESNSCSNSYGLDNTTEQWLTPSKLLASRVSGFPFDIQNFLEINGKFTKAFKIVSRMATFQFLVKRLIPSKGGGGGGGLSTTEHIYLFDYHVVVQFYGVLLGGE